MVALPFSQSGTLADAEQKIGQAFVEVLQKQFGEELLFVVVFGSKARGDDDEESDIDFLVVLRQVSLEVREQVRDISADVWLANGDTILSTLVWDEAYWEKMEKLSTSLFRNICKDGILIYQQASIEV